MMGAMAGIVFDDTQDVDPATPLLASFVEWVDLLAARRSIATTSGYVSDAAVFARALLELTGKPAPDVPDVDASALPTHLVRDGRPVVPVTAYLRATAAMSVLTLGDLHPRLCARALDSLGATRAAASQRRLASAWSSLCALTVRRGLLAANPMEHEAIDRPKRPGPAPAPMDNADAATMLDTILSPDPAARRPWPGRDFALAALLLSAGLRVAEACGTTIGDLRTMDETPRIRVRGKGGKLRTIPLHPDTVAALRGYLLDRETRTGSFTVTDPLFVRANGTAFTTRAMRRLVDRWYLRSGIYRAPGACVHALRHTFATSALDSGASVVELQTLLGHASLDTTRRYLAVVGNGLDAAIRAHPMGALVATAAGHA